VTQFRGRIRGLALYVAAFVAAVSAPSAQALNTVSLSPASTTVALGDPVALDLRIDLTDASIGGGVEIQFDVARLQFVSFSFESGLGDEPAFRCEPSSPTASCNESFPGTVEIGFAKPFFGPDFIGTVVVGTLVFDAIAQGSAYVNTDPSAGFPGPFGDPFGSPLLISQWNDASVQIVPEPVSALLLLSGLSGFALLRRRRAPRA